MNSKRNRLRMEYRKGRRRIEIDIPEEGGDFGDFSMKIRERELDGRSERRISIHFKSEIELIRMDYLSMKIGNPEYIILGGLRYMERGEEISAVPHARTSFPFDRYYSQKIEPVGTKDGEFMSSIYLKMPIALMEYGDSFRYVVHTPVMYSKNNVRLLSFLHMSHRLILSIFGDYSYLFKESLWLGKPKKIRKRTEMRAGDSIEIAVHIVEGKGGWKEGVLDFLRREGVDAKEAPSDLKSIKRALRRCYNHSLGCFMQLPYKRAPGFLFSDYSYNLLAFEAIRLALFHRAWSSTGDKEYLRWSESLRELLKKDAFSKRTKNGRVWYNSSVFDGKGLRPFTYLGDTYGAYPGGQAQLIVGLMEYMERSGKGDFDPHVKETLEYIINTQNPDGSWPMARRDTLLFSRPGTLKRRSVGNTAACIISLAMAYRRYGERRYLESARKGIAWMNSGHPKGYNAVLDAGIDEVEGLSAIYAIDANIEMFRTTEDTEFLRKAEEWALHAMTWVHLWDSPELDIKWTMGPFSTTITPRVSPYETVKLSNSLHELYRVGGDETWERISNALLSKTLEFREMDGGLSEAFSITEDGLKEIPVEQCFGTAELLRAYLRNPVRGTEETHISPVELRLSGRDVFMDDEKVMNISKNGMISIFGLDMGLSFYNVYSKEQRKRLKLHRMKKRLGKLSLVTEIPNIWRGYGHPEVEKGISMWENIGKDVRVHMGERKVDVDIDTEFHRVRMSASFEERRAVVDIDVMVKEQDLDMAKHILIPYFRKKGRVSAGRGEISFYTESGEIRALSTDRMEVSEIDEFIGFNATLESNWTHGGIFSTRIIIDRQKD